MRLVLAALLTALLASSASASTDGKNRKITLTNLSSQTIKGLYASPVTATTWEENLFGTRLLGPGQSISANIDNGTNECNYDLEIIFSDDHKIDKRKINICAISKWTIRDSGDSMQ